jgi:hypothetical protein
MKIAIIGSGHIGAGLARAWIKRGHDVAFGAREPRDAELTALCSQIGARANGVADAAAGADVVVLAIPFGAIDDVLRAAGDLAGKVVIDCTNAVERGAGGMSLVYGHTTSAAEELQKKLPAAHVFKSFNAQGAENLANPSYDGVAAANFFCGDDAASKRIVRGLVEDVGFEAIDAGPLRNARLLEPLMLLWIASSQALGTRDVAFKLLRRS